MTPSKADPGSAPQFDIIPARGPGDVQAAAGLFAAYTASLGIDLAYQDYAAELAGLPGKYAPPGGELLLARLRSDVGHGPGEAVGCVALRPLPLPEEKTPPSTAGPQEAPSASEGPAHPGVGSTETRKRCELKRLYVAPAARGTGLGLALFKAVLGEARARGYTEVMLDTLSEMRPAIAMYEKQGFVVIEEPYYEGPHPLNTVFMRLEL